MSKQNLEYAKLLNSELGFIDIEIEFEIKEESPKQEIEEKIEEYSLGPREPMKNKLGDRKMRRKSFIKINGKPIRDYQSNPNSFMLR